MREPTPELDERTGWRGFLMPIGVILGLAGLIIGIWFLLDDQLSANVAALLYEALGDTGGRRCAARRQRQPHCRQGGPCGRGPGRGRGRHLALLRRAQRHRHASFAALARPAAAVGLRWPRPAAADRLPGLAGRLDHRQVAHGGRRPRQLGVGADQPRQPPDVHQQHPLAGRGGRRCGRARPAHRGPRRPCQVRVDRQDVRLPAAGHLARRRIGHLALRVRLEAGRAGRRSAS